MVALNSYSRIADGELLANALGERCIPPSENEIMCVFQSSVIYFGKYPIIIERQPMTADDAACRGWRGLQITRSPA